jgi:non-heme Fe2+,alpha-ketoglutarate-dependent halogenase
VKEAVIATKAATPLAAASESVPVEFIPGLMLPNGEVVEPSEPLRIDPDLVKAGIMDADGESVDVEKGRTFLNALKSKSEKLQPRARQAIMQVVNEVYPVYTALQRYFDRVRTELDLAERQIELLESGAAAEPHMGDGWIHLGPVPDAPPPVAREDRDKALEHIHKLQEFQFGGSAKVAAAAEDLELSFLYLEQTVARFEASAADAIRRLAELTGTSDTAEDGTPRVQLVERPPVVRDPQADRSPFALTPEQASFLEENGYIGPLTMCSEDEMARVRHWIDQEGFLHKPSPIYDAVVGGRVLRDWHLVYPEIFELCAHPALIESMASVYGADILLWRSQFMLKEIGYTHVAWHQDGSFPGSGLRPALSEAKNVSVWIAIDEANETNGCVRVIPGSHRESLEVSADTSDVGDGLFGRRYKVAYKGDPSKAVSLSLRPGQFFIFDGGTLHGSTRNPSLRRRLGLSVRYTTPDVKVYEDQTEDGQGYSLENHGCVLVRGEDRYGHNVMVDPPARR